MGVGQIKIAFRSDFENVGVGMKKTLALIFMLIDHIGMILFPNCIILRIIGRLSMPLFAYGIARGYNKANQKKCVFQYAKRLFWFSLISQIPYGVLSVWVFDEFSLNIGFTWLFSVGVMYLLDRDINVRSVSLILIILTASLTFNIDYGFYGVLLPALIYRYMIKTTDKKQYVFFGMGILTAPYILLTRKIIQIFALASFLLLLIPAEAESKLRLPKNIYYWFYPIHISVLLFLKYILV